MRATYLTACVISALVILWLATGQLREQPEPPASNIAEQNRRVAAMQEEKVPTRVRVTTVHATERARELTVRGRTQNKRSVMVQSQIDGLVVSRPVERGDSVAEGDLLCQISVEDREAVLAEALSSAEQAQLEFEGATKLSRQGLQSETAIAQSRARLAGASARVKQAELDMARLEIRAPFNGVVENVHMEVGQFVGPGSNCVTLVDLDPMLLVGSVSEIELPNVTTGLTAHALLPDGRRVSGEVSFVGKTAEDGTRTYPIEIHVENAGLDIPSGVSAQIRIPVESLPAQKISPALLVLDDTGRMGVRTIDAENTVEFHPVHLLGDDTDGIWVTGLPSVARLITVGQQLVVSGELVEPTHDSATHDSAIHDSAMLTGVEGEGDTTL